MENYFTSNPLISTLRKENIGAAGTTRPLGIGFPALLIVLRKACLLNSSRNYYCRCCYGILGIGWRDNSFVLGLSRVSYISPGFKVGPLQSVTATSLCT